MKKGPVKNIVCKFCSKNKIVPIYFPTKFCSYSCRSKYYAPAGHPCWCHLKGEERYNWKGDKVGYRGLHQWVNRRLGKPMCCDMCGDLKKSRYHWANKSHEYKRDITDWIRLCAKCHKEYDK